MANPVVLRFPNLTVVDIDELREELLRTGVQGSDLKVEPPSEVDPDRAGDFGVTAATVIISAAAITAIGTWLSKNRQKTQLDQTVERYENGQLTERRIIHLRDSNSTGPNPQIVHELAAAAGTAGRAVASGDV